ncbi:hypothetical protein J7I98_30595 [Streptomyces sp. ISL-98]|uniref:hypothetical protein n=1 Tax=Streptomyces sp. ISL-98 TaxID=2819192 RepID=UPI001BEA1814|nr:hypothetical protein [Streptomyces sp. ISL-98]MBT2510131.1 hypothetical protein [Streptomyces sp. ISL-98]
MHHTRTDTDTAITNWLARTLDVPAVARQEWQDGAVAMLPLGGLFDAVRMPAVTVHAAAGNDDRAFVARFLAEILDGGPVIHDPFSWYYALMPPQTSETWRSPFATCIGRGAWLGVPRTDRTALETGGPYWSVPMQDAGVLGSPEAVAELIRIGHARLTAAS